MIRIFKPILNTNVINQELPKVFASGMIGTGKKCDEFTTALSKKFGREECILTNSATSALSLTYTLLRNKFKRAGQWGRWDSPTNVLTTSLTCWAATTAIIREGFRPQWVDIDPKTFCLDMDDLEAKLDRYTQVISWTSWGGCLPDFNRFKKLQTTHKEKYGKDLYIVLDLAHAFGSTYLGREIPYYLMENFFHAYSFGPIKTLTCGGSGGALVCPPDFYDEAERLSWYGISRRNNSSFRAFSDITEVGSKWNSDDVSATIGLANLLIVPNAIYRSQENAAYYLKHISNPYIDLLPAKTFEGSACWLFSAIVDNRDKFIEYMAANGIEANGIHRGNHTLEVCRSYYQDLPNFNEYEDRYVSWPVGVYLSWSEIRRIVEKINNYK